jgi:hypothetical protein
MNLRDSVILSAFIHQHAALVPILPMDKNVESFSYVQDKGSYILTYSENGHIVMTVRFRMWMDSVVSIMVHNHVDDTLHVYTLVRDDTYIMSTL